MIRHDRSNVSIVTTCTDCPWWYAFSFELERAEDSAIWHRINVHGLPEGKAMNTRRERERRKKQRT